MAQLVPYLSFERNCREAMTFYNACLGGELFLQTVSESPIMAKQMPPGMENSILHSSLTSGNLMFMASDLNREVPIEGNTVQLCINCDSEEQMRAYFSKLAAGGIITEQIADMPWGGKYGSLKDKFGKYWLFNFQK